MKKAVAKVVKTVVAAVKTVKQVTVAAAYYGAYLLGRGATQHTNVNNYSWRIPVSKIANNNRSCSGTCQVSGTVSGFTPNDLEGKAVIGQTSGTVKGTLTVTGNQWRFFGTFKADSALYDFDINQKGRTAAGQLSTVVGYGLGEYYRYGSLGGVQPQSYTLVVDGVYNFEASGTF